jgi:thiamine biosynthesis lipoprotein
MTEPKQQAAYVKSDSAEIPGMQRFSHEAMATTFEVMVVHEDTRYAQQAAAAAFDELDRLEADLSRFIENSDIARINNLPANRPLRLGLAAFECLQLSTSIYAETNGAFDITIGSLLACWLSEDKTSRSPSKSQLNLARQHTGTHLIKLDQAEHTVELLASPIQVDLGGVGKGYALDRIAELLREWDIDTALIHGGFSSVLALDKPPGTKAWPLTLSRPGPPDAGRQTIARIDIKNQALGGSGLQKGQHIIDPRTAKPVEDKRAAWACAHDAATADALSTAFMVMSPDEIEQYCSHHSNILAMIVLKQEDTKRQEDRILRFGPWDKLGA